MAPCARRGGYDYGHDNREVGLLVERRCSAGAYSMHARKDQPHSLSLCPEPSPVIPSLLLANLDGERGPRARSAGAPARSGKLSCFLGRRSDTHFEAPKTTVGSSRLVLGQLYRARYHALSHLKGLVGVAGRGSRQITCGPRANANECASAPHGCYPHPSPIFCRRTPQRAHAFTQHPCTPCVVCTSTARPASVRLFVAQMRARRRTCCD